MRTTGQRMHWTVGLPPDSEAGWGDSAFVPVDGVRELVLRLDRGWTSREDDLQRDQLVRELRNKVDALTALSVLLAGAAVTQSLRAWWRS